MKTVVTFFFLVIITSASFGQQPSTDTIEFKQKNAKQISITQLKEGKNSFFAEDSTKLILTLKKGKVVDQQYYSPAGEVISSARIADALRQCVQCTTIRYPDGKTERVCWYVPCATANGINKRLNY